MNVIVNYSNENDMAAKLELDENVAKFNAMIIKEKIDRLSIDNSNKRILLKEVKNYFNQD